MNPTFTKLFISVFIVTLLTVFKVSGQFFVPLAGSNQIDCGLNTTLCDHAGCSSDYSPGADGFSIIQTVGSTSVSLTGNYNLGAGDQIIVYSGAGVGGSVLATLSGSGTYTYSTFGGQQLTIRFISDESSQSEGFSFTVTYSGTCAYPTVNFGISGTQNFPCATNRFFTDNGGSSSNYSDGASSSVVLNNAGVGIYILEGNYSLESGFDFIRLYNGVGTGGTLIATYTGTGTFFYTTEPGQIITIQFSSDASVNDLGFEIFVTHYGGCSCPTNIISASAEPASVCINGNSQLYVNGTDRVDNYTVGYPVYSPLPCSGNGGGAGPSGDDITSPALTLPFPFTFFGTTYTEFGISTNGNIQFGAGPYSTSYLPSGNGIPSTNIDRVVALNFGDWMADPGAINWYVQGTAPNRRVVICFDSLYPYPAGSSGELTGQVILYEGTNIIDLVITNSFMGTDASTYNSQTQGLQNQEGQGVTVPGRNAADWSENNSTVRFSPSGSYQYQWSPATFLNNTTAIDPIASNISSSQIYTVTATIGSLCSQMASVNITVNPVPAITISGDLNICSGETTSISASGGSSYEWFDGSTGNSVNVAPSITEAFSVSVSNGGCTEVETITVTVGNTPVPNAFAYPSTLCSGQSSTIYASGGGNYNWSTGATSASISVSPASSQIYYVTVSDNGCVSTDSVNIIVSTSGLPTFICPDDITLVGCEPVAIFDVEATDPCALPICEVSPLETVLSNFLSIGTAITGSITNPYNFNLDGIGGPTAISIIDGGDDMYDGGNLFSTNFGSTNIPYSDGNILGNNFLGSGGRYFTAKINNMFVFAADINGISDLFITGNNGADGLGTVNGFTYSVTVGCMTYDVFVKRVNGTNDPSINQIFIVPAGSGATHSFSTDSDLSDHTLSNLNAATRIYYLLIAGSNGYAYSNIQIQRIVQNFLNQTSASSYVPNSLTITQTSGLPSGSVFPVGNTVVTYSATGSQGTSQCSFNVNVAPTPGPLMTCPDDINLSDCNPVATFDIPEALDPCVAPCEISTLSEILNNLNTNNSVITSGIPNPYNFSLDGPGGASSTYIADGGNDMFDVGNVLNTNLFANIPYSSGSVISNPAFGAGGQYFTQKYGNLFVLVADMNGVGNFYTTGNNGADGGGTVFGFNYSVTVGCESYDVFVKQIYGTSDPSINQIFIIPSRTGASHSFSNDSDNGFHELNNLDAVSRMFYLLVAGNSGYAYTNTEIQNIVINFLTQVSATVANPVTVIQTNGLPSGSSFPLGTTLITFEATGPSGVSTCSFNVNVSPGITVDAGNDTTVCASNPILNLNGSVINAGGGIWSSSGTGSFSSATDLITSYTASAADTVSGAVTIRLSSTGNGSCPPYFEDITLTFQSSPIAYAGTDQTICADSDTVYLSGNITNAGGGLWTSNGSGNFSPSANDLNAIYLPSSADSLSGSVTLSLNSIFNDFCPTETDDIILSLSPVPSPPSISSISGSVCPNTTLGLTATGGNIGLGTTINWYSGPNGSGSLLGSGRDIYVVPNGSATYYVRREGGICAPTIDSSITVNTKNYVYAADGTTSNTYCTDNDGWHHFYVGDNIIYSLHGDLSTMPAGFPEVRINVNSNFYQSPALVPICNISTQEEKFEMARSWDLNIGPGSATGNYKLRFYFIPQERIDIENAANTWISSYPTCSYNYKYALPNGFYWFKNSGAPYTAPLYDDIHYSATNGITFNGINYSEWTGITGFSGGSGSIILVPDPVLNSNHLSFYGENKKLFNQLNWTVENNRLINKYILEKSQDGISFEPITEISSVENLFNYQYDDWNPFNGENYYRLRVHHPDNVSELSKIILLNNQTNSTEYSFYPNPADKFLIFQYFSKNYEEIRLEIFDILGRFIKMNNYISVEGRNNHQISTDDLIPGSYYIKVIHNNKAIHSSIFQKK